MKTEIANTLKGIKGTFTKIMVAGALAGAVMLAAPQKADAQQFGFHIGFGRPVAGPVYAAPAYGPVYAAPYAPVYRPGFYADYHRDDFYRHQRWERDRQFHGRGYYR